MPIPHMQQIHRPALMQDFAIEEVDEMEIQQSVTSPITAEIHQFQVLHSPKRLQPSTFSEKELRSPKRVKTPTFTDNDSS